MSQNKIYKYYSTMRYLDIGTFPKDCFELKNYETRKNIKKKKMIVSMLMKIKNILMRA